MEFAETLNKAIEDLEARLVQARQAELEAAEAVEALLGQSPQLQRALRVSARKVGGEAAPESPAVKAPAAQSPVAAEVAVEADLGVASLADLFAEGDVHAFSEDDQDTDEGEGDGEDEAEMDPWAELVGDVAPFSGRGRG